MAKKTYALPEDPQCSLGYTQEQVQRIVGPHYTEFQHYMRGQTVALCDDHGMITYGSDLRHFMLGNRTPLD